MPNTTPLLGFPYMVDGSPDNTTLLQRSLRLLDVASNLVLESVTTTTTPTDPQPGQAWFIPQGTVLTGGWGVAFGTDALPSPIIAAYLQANDLGTLVLAEGWVSLPVPDVLYGYIKDVGGRRQWDGSSWTSAAKVQAATLNKFWSASGPVRNPFDVAAFVAMKAPFDMEILSIDIAFSGGSVVSAGSSGERAMFAPQVKYTSDATQAFSAWTTLVEPGSAAESGGWDAATLEAASADAYNLGLTTLPSTDINAATRAPFHGVTIADGDTIAMGNWFSGSFGSAVELFSCDLTSMTINYKSI